MASYWKHCTECGGRIQLREMPQGQWVAFETYDRVHDCPGKTRTRRRPPLSVEPTSQPATRKSQPARAELLRLLGQHRHLRIRYRDGTGRVTDRNIQVVSVGPDSVDTFCELRDAPRTFRLDGILDAQPVATQPIDPAGQRLCGHSGARCCRIGRFVVLARSRVIGSHGEPGDADTHGVALGL